MGGSFDLLGVENVVRAHHNFQQVLIQLAHNKGVVVHSLQQHRLVAQSHPGPGQFQASLPGFRGHFQGVIEVSVDVNRQMARKNGAQLVVYPEGKGGQGTGTDTLDLHVGDTVKLLQQPGELMIFKHKAVAAGQEHIADLFIRPDIIQSSLDLAPGCGIVSLTDIAAALTVPAVHGALVGHHDHYAVGVTPGNGRSRRGVLLVHGVGDTIRIPVFKSAGNSLPSNGIRRVRGIHQAQVVRRHGPAADRSGQVDFLDLLCGEM